MSTLRMRNIVCFHVWPKSRPEKGKPTEHRLINKLDPLHRAHRHDIGTHNLPRLDCRVR